MIKIEELRKICNESNSLERYELNESLSKVILSSINESFDDDEKYLVSELYGSVHLYSEIIAEEISSGRVNIDENWITAPLKWIGKKVFKAGEKKAVKGAAHTAGKWAYKGLSEDAAKKIALELGLKETETITRKRVIEYLCKMGEKAGVLGAREPARFVSDEALKISVEAQERLITDGLFRVPKKAIEKCAGDKVAESTVENAWKQAWCNVSKREGNNVLKMSRKKFQEKVEKEYQDILGKSMKSLDKKTSKNVCRAAGRFLKNSIIGRAIGRAMGTALAIGGTTAGLTVGDKAISAVNKSIDKNDNNDGYANLYPTIYGAQYVNANPQDYMV